MSPLNLFFDNGLRTARRDSAPWTTPPPRGDETQGTPRLTDRLPDGGDIRRAIDPELQSLTSREPAVPL